MIMRGWLRPAGSWGDTPLGLARLALALSASQRNVPVSMMEEGARLC